MAQTTSFQEIPGAVCTVAHHPFWSWGEGRIYSNQMAYLDFRNGTLGLELQSAT